MPTVQPRVFVVGCPRSGTTLLQAMLAAHPDLLSFAETHYFHKVWGRLWPARRLHVVSPRAARRTASTLSRTVGLDAHTAPPAIPLIDFYGPYFTKVVDAAAVAAGAQGWVEKTPIHLHCIPEITKFVRSARFVHILRDGREVVASLVDFARRTPELWLPQLGGDPRDVPDELGLVELAAARWNNDLSITREHRGHSGHLVTNYVDLVNDTERVARTLCEFLGLPFAATMCDPSTAATQVTGWRAPLEHMAGPFEPITHRPLEKFAQLSASAQSAAVNALTDGGKIP